MKMIPKPDKRLSVLCVCLLLAGCAKPSTQMPVFDAAQVVQEESSQRASVAGRTKPLAPVPAVSFTPQELRQMRKRLALHADRVVSAGQKLCEMMGRDPNTCIYMIRLTTKDAESLNAYADGEKIYVTPSMMRFATQDEALGAVLSHEYAHNIMGHIEAKKRNAVAGMVFGALADIAAASQGYDTGGAMSEIGVDSGIRAFSPDFEREADYVGMYVMALAQYDITQAPNLWRQMTAADPEGAFLTGTHPSNPERSILLTYTKDEIIAKFRKGQLLVPNQAPAR
ncbi:MAG: M48 family metalloprotease [Rickettsiales bacterium]|nr:M48 family metalloprotease [Rickettsiales bacterium]